MFRTWREDNERRSEETVYLWATSLYDKLHKLDAERHLVLEQVIIAALDCNQIILADECIEKLAEEFPFSLRVKKFEAMRLEAIGKFDEALDMLNGIIAQDETNAAPRKRKIAIYRAKGKNTDAIRELCEYTKMYVIHGPFLLLLLLEYFIHISGFFIFALQIHVRPGGMARALQFVYDRR